MHSSGLGESPSNTRMNGSSAAGWSDMSALEIEKLEVSGLAGELSLARHARGR